LWNGPDGKARKCYPVVGAFQVDYPESCLLTLVRVGQACPICLTSKEDFGLITTKKHQLRTVEAMKNVYIETTRLDKKAAESLLQAKGLVNAKVYI
jgi:Plavaka transposase